MGNALEWGCDTLCCVYIGVTLSLVCQILDVLIVSECLSYEDSDSCTETLEAICIH